jgi:hypothetical protein
MARSEDLTPFVLTKTADLPRNELLLLESHERVEAGQGMGYGNMHQSGEQKDRH